jgi:hypothetical protein
MPARALKGRKKARDGLAKRPHCALIGTRLIRQKQAMLSIPSTSDHLLSISDFPRFFPADPNFFREFPESSGYTAVNSEDPKEDAP